jgi:hypothetical protein
VENTPLDNHFSAIPQVVDILLRHEPIKLTATQSTADGDRFSNRKALALIAAF